MGYLNTPVKLKENDPRLSGHSNRWESGRIAYIFSSMGYDVDAIDLNQSSYVPALCGL